MNFLHAMGMLMGSALAIRLFWSDGQASAAIGVFNNQPRSSIVYTAIAGCCRVAYIAWACTAVKVALPASHTATQVLASPVAHAVFAAVLGQVGTNKDMRTPLLLMCVHRSYYHKDNPHSCP